jgi:AcrR family transcriptional regulator
MARPRSFDRDAALELAMRAFWERGYEETSISDLTAAMGIAPPSLYAAFGDKRRLFEEALERYQSGPGDIVMRGLAEPTARAAVARMLREAAGEYALEGQPRGCWVVEEPALGALREQSRAAIRARLQQGADAGELPPGTDLDGLTGYVAAVIAGLSARARDGASAAELEAIAAQAMRGWPEA